MPRLRGIDPAEPVIWLIDHQCGLFRTVNDDTGEYRRHRNGLDAAGRKGEVSG